MLRPETSEDSGVRRKVQSPNSPSPQNSVGRGAPLTCSALGVCVSYISCGHSYLNHAKFAMESFGCNEQFVESPAPREIACPNSTQPAGMTESPRKQENQEPVPPRGSDWCPQPPQRACAPAACASKGDGAHQSLPAGDPLPHPDLRDLPGPRGPSACGKRHQAGSGHRQR